MDISNKLGKIHEKNSIVGSENENEADRLSSYHANDTGSDN